MARRIAYPHCSRCGVEHDPHESELRRRYYATDTQEYLCEECCREDIKEYLKTNFPDAATFLGYIVSEVGDSFC